MLCKKMFGKTVLGLYLLLCFDHVSFSRYSKVWWRERAIQKALEAKYP